tara:strand:+ start:194 stop:301 length:108 start_codon:yes stop_codon:yes gene_type:complete
MFSVNELKLAAQLIFAVLKNTSRTNFELKPELAHR